MIVERHLYSAALHVRIASETRKEIEGLPVPVSPRRDGRRPTLPYSDFPQNRYKKARPVLPGLSRKDSLVLPTT